jgi:hypothetical protein
MAVLSSAQAAEKYGIPLANPGSEFAKNAYQGDPKVLPYAKETRDTSAKATVWSNQNPGRPGSFQDFGGSNPTMAQPGA